MLEALGSDCMTWSFCQRFLLMRDYVCDTVLVQAQTMKYESKKLRILPSGEVHSMLAPG